MEIIITGKLLKFIIYTAIILTVIALLFLGIGIYQNHKYFNEYVDMPINDDTTYSTIVIEWLADYENDIALQEQSQRDLVEIQKRLEALGVEFNE